MQITYGDGAADAFRETVRQIPAGWIVALLGDGEEPDSSGVVPGVDVFFVAATAEGVEYREIDAPPYYLRPRGFAPWESIDRIHVY
jgi:hypothetical protein